MIKHQIKLWIKVPVFYRTIKNIETRILIPREGFSGNNSSRLVTALEPNNTTCPIQEPAAGPSVLNL